MYAYKYVLTYLRVVINDAHSLEVKIMHKNEIKILHLKYAHFFNSLFLPELALLWSQALVMRYCERKIKIKSRKYEKWNKKIRNVNMKEIKF